ncbi:MAG: A/G-specific adenine glycosylase [Bacteroidetes bacterium]|nr:A/G-specific adenine glycosylase [Bacteroidota bacterium]
MIKFSTQLTNWYRNNARDLPWRNTRNPYHIWISEVILQQTRINQGLAYYLRFIDRFPTIDLLANADQQEILLLWQGLGYYSRARNMHEAAKQVQNLYNGIFPSTYDQIIKLKGVGEYTAAAIASIAFGESKVVVDGNVLRFLSRFQGYTQPINTSKGKTAIREMAETLLQNADPAIFNQALMEFGALYCVPRNPDCSNCIFSNSCQAFSAGIVNDLPVKSKRVTIRKRFFNYLFLYYFNENNQIIFFIQQRGKGDIWHGLFDLPLIEDDKCYDFDKLTVSDYWNENIANHHPVISTTYKDFIHQLTHQQLNTRFFAVKLENYNSHLIKEEWIGVTFENHKEYPTSRLIENYLNIIIPTLIK